MTKGLRLGDYCDKIGSGATPRGGKEVYLAEGPYSLIRSQNIYNHGFEFSGLAYIDEEQAKKLKNVEVLGGDVLVNITGDSVARACQVHCSVLPARVNQHVAILRPQARYIDPLFLRYWLVTPIMQARLLGLASAGATRNALTKVMLENVYVPAFTIDDQKRIAEVLGSLDDKIELNRRMNETLEAMAQAIFRDWFVDFGPTRRKTDGISDPIEAMGGLVIDADRAQQLAELFPSDFGDNDLPVSWKVGTLADLATPAGVTISPSEIPSDTPYIGLEHMPRRSLALTEWDEASKVTSNKSIFKRGQILFGKLRPYFHKVGIAPIDGVCSTDIIVLDAHNERQRAIVASCVSTDEFVAFTDRSSTGTKMPRTSWGNMKNYKLALASPLVNEAYADTVAPLFEKMMNNSYENRTLSAIRDLLLPKLMTGEICLQEVEELAREVA